jgi:hypothetical protein
MCSAKGALGFTFGETGVPFGSRLERSMGMGWELKPAMAPFTKAQALATPWSGRLAQIEYEVSESDKERGEMALLTLATAAEAAGWVRNSALEEPDKLPFYLTPVSGDIVYDVPGGEGVVASISYGLGTLRLACANKALLRANAEEAFGKLPPGTPRPVALAVDPGTKHSAADCSRPEAQEAMLTVLDGRPDAITARIMLGLNHTERLTEWKSWRLRESGKVSAERLAALTIEALEASSPGGDPLAGFALFPELFATLKKLAHQSDAGDKAGACRAALEMADVYRRMEAISSRQWKAMDALLEAEARKAGVSLD